MHRLQVGCLKVGILPGHLQRGMPKRALKPEHIPAFANVVHSERVTQGVDREPHTADPKPCAKDLEMPEHVPL